jgi:hypothetical protein
MTERKIRDAFAAVSMEAPARARILAALEDAAETSPGKEDGMTRQKNRKLWRGALLAAALVALLSVSVFAATSNGTTFSNARSSGYDYPSYRGLSAAAREIGAEIAVPESFDTGARFRGARIVENTDYDEYGHSLRSYKTLDMEYADREGRTIELTAGRDRLGEEAAVAPGAVWREIGGVRVFAGERDYRLVPPDYEKTAEDLAREESGELQIGYGDCETAQELHYSYGGFRWNGTSYDMLSFDGVSPETLFAMAEEILTGNGD